MLYTCGNHVFRSTDEGHSWQPISPDLTRADKSKLKASGGPITKDTSGAEHYATIYTFRESAHEPGVFWSGSDDGLVYISRDNGENWIDVTPSDLPEWSYIRTVEPSPHDPATLYLAATRYKLDDPAPYVYKTTDYGQSWQKIVNGIPAGDFIRVVRADPDREGLLYAGSETGLYVSLDDGDRWMRWEGNFPVTPVYDMKVKEGDLVIGTHGRSFWIMDDLTPLRQLKDNPDTKSVLLFQPRRAYRILPDIFADWTSSEGKGYAIGLTTAATFISEKTEDGQLKRTFLDVGEGAPRGVAINYILDGDVDASAASLSILDADGALVRTFEPKPAGYESGTMSRRRRIRVRGCRCKPGPNRFFWNLRHAGSVPVPGDKTAVKSLAGPFVLPGMYQVQLTVGETVQTQSFEVVNDPRSTVSRSDLAEQLALLQRIHDKISEAHGAIIRLRSVRKQLAGWRTRLSDQTEILDLIDGLGRKLDAVEDELILPGEQKDTFGLNQRVRLNAALCSVISVVASADARPTVQAGELAEEYFAKIDMQIEKLEDALTSDLPKLNKMIQGNVPPIVA